MKQIPKKQARMIARLKKDSFSSTALRGAVGTDKTWDKLLSKAGITRKT